MSNIDTEKARALMKQAFPRIEMFTKYIAVYRTNRNYEIALEREDRVLRWWGQEKVNPA